MKKILNIISVFFLKGFGAASILLISFYIAHSFSVSISGQFFWYFSLMIIISQLLSFGANDFILKKSSISEGDVETAIVAGNITSVLFIAFLVLILLVYPFYWLSNDTFYLALCLFFLGSAGLAISNLCSYVFQGHLHHKKAVYFLNIGPYFFGGGLIFFLDVKGFFSLSVVFIMGVIINTVVAILICFYYRYLLISFAGFEKFLKEFFVNIKWYWVICVSSVFINWGGVYFSGFILDDRELAILNISMRISMVLNFLLIAVNVLVAPQIAFLFEKGEIEKLQNTVSNALSFIYLVSIPCFIFLTFFSSELLLFINDSFGSGAYVLVILCVGQLFNVLTGPSGYLLSMTGREATMGKVYFINAIVFVIILFSLGAVYGIYGVALGMALSMLLFNFTVALVVKFSLGIYLLPRAFSFIYAKGKCCV